jgi:hypothetical protein
VRLAGVDEGRIDEAQPLHAVGVAFGLDRFEHRDAGLVVRHDELPAANVRHAEGAAELVEPPRPSTQCRALSEPAG